MILAIPGHNLPLHFGQRRPESPPKVLILLDPGLRISGDTVEDELDIIAPGPYVAAPIQAAGVRRVGYFGSKATSGLCQPLIAMMPPHDTYIETHLGGGAIMRRKPAALHNIGIDRDARALGEFECDYRVELTGGRSQCAASVFLISTSGWFPTVGRSPTSVIRATMSQPIVQRALLRSGFGKANLSNRRRGAVANGCRPFPLRPLFSPPVPLPRICRSAPSRATSRVVGSASTMCFGTCQRL